MFSTMKKKATAVAFVAAGALTIVGATSAQAHSSVDGCPYGAVCVYDTDSASPQSRAIFYSSGYHNLSNEFGFHRVFNNQYGGWTFRLCTGYNGVGCGDPVRPGRSVYQYLTPINSITLQPPPAECIVKKTCY